MSTTIIQGDCRAVLPTMPDDSFDCCVTSPPYWGLRDYGTATWEGGDPECDHKQALARRDGGRENINCFHGSARWDSDKGAINFKDVCGKCGARRVDAQIGLEPTLDAYVETMRDVFRGVRRVLKPIGTCWLNLGDCYCSTDKWGGGGNTGKQTVAHDGSVPSWQVRERKQPQRGLKPKDLCFVPHRVAMALQADGWWLRSAIIWHKPNPMPESVTDRPTSAYEMVFLLTKSERYFYDADAIAEPSDPSCARDQREKYTGGNGGVQHAKSNLRTVSDTRNARNVWTIATQPYRGAHFATMPPDLAERCIKAGCPKGGRVLDPFGGSGTTGLVADRLGRNATLIELNAKYLDLQSDRISADAGLFAEVAHA